jgi:pimeloyl-ACP methyl ester carboxylesterase
MRSQADLRTTYHWETVGGVRLFYRRAGPHDAPALVLLHGFPSSSRMYEKLFPALATCYQLIAPDYPGFGHSDAPPPSSFSYTFDQLAGSMRDLLKALGVQRYSLFLQDYGGPVGFRLAMNEPSCLQALIIQNANAYLEGLGPKWAGLARYWEDPAANPAELDGFLSFEGAKARHVGASPHPELYDPDSWKDEAAWLARPGQRAIQSALLRDYRTNIESYPLWQAWLRETRPPTLVLWGRYDPSFVQAGAFAYRRDHPDAEIHLLDAGHFALDEAADQVATLAGEFLARTVTSPALAD